MAAFAMVITCMATESAAQEFSTHPLIHEENQHQWVCDYERDRDDVLQLRCDDLVGLLYDQVIFEDGPQSKTTLFIPIWSRPKNDEAAVNLVRILLCKQNPGCSVEMSPAFAANN